MPRKNDGEGTRDREKKGGTKSKSFIPYSKKHVRRLEETLIRGSTAPGQGTNGHSKDGKGKNKKK
jgi:hypothetical protein